jgi:hypothetical protein
MAAQQGHEDVVRLLLDSRARVDAAMTVSAPRDPPTTLPPTHPPTHFPFYAPLYQGRGESVAGKSDDKICI